MRSASLTVLTRWATRSVVRSRMNSRSPVEDRLLGAGVHAGQGVVEDQDLRVAQQRPGDGGALLLARRRG